MSEIIRDLIKFINSGLSGVTKDIKGLYEHVISGVKVISSFNENKVQIFGKQLEDLFALLKLMKLMVENS